MKKITTLIICLFLVGGAMAQEKTFSWGVKAGLNLSNVTGSDVEDGKMKPGFYAGVLAEYRVSTLFAVSPELMFSTQGYKLKGEGDIRFNANYINLPILAKFYVIEKLSLEIGPQFGYAISVKGKYEDESEKIESDLYKAFDLSIGVGATYNFGKVSVSARYNYGLTDIMKEMKNKNSVIQVGVGYKF